MKKVDILVAGNYFVDLVFTGLDTLPILGKEIYSKDFEMIPGGAFNTAVALHRLGVNVIWATDFGCDDFSKYVKERAIKEGMDSTFFISHQRLMRKITVSLSYPSDRAFITYEDPDENIPAIFKAVVKTSPKYILLPGMYYGKNLSAGLFLLKSRGINLIMDGNSSEDICYSMPAIRKVLESTSIFMPNASEIRRLAGENDLEKAIIKIGELSEIIVVKDGRNGAYGYSQTENKILHAEPINISEPLDTTGAGDIFNAGFLAAWLKGKSFQESLRWGCIAGGLSTLGKGGTGQMITEKEITSALY